MLEYLFLLSTATEGGIELLWWLVPGVGKEEGAQNLMEL